MTIQEKIFQLSRIFSQKFPEPETELMFNTPYQLLIATMMAAQSTDKQVNIITETLFRVAPDAESMIKLSEDEIANYIRSINYYKTKAKHIRAASDKIVHDFGGKVPETLDELQQLPGVGRKTASVLLICAFNKPAFPVDTHVFRLANRIGIAEGKSVLEVENKLRKRIDPGNWYNFHHYLILHGRYTCKAVKPLCNKCEIIDYCKFFKSGSAN